MDVDQQGVNLELPPPPQLDLTEEEEEEEEEKEEEGEKEEEAEVLEVKLCLKIKCYSRVGEKNTTGFPKFTPQTAMSLNMKPFSHYKHLRRFRIKVT